jgi:hypothetical protein
LLGKITSARFIVTVGVIGTLCAAIFGIFDILERLLQPDIKPNDTLFNLVKDIIFMLLGAFIATVSSITTLYFGRQDRTKEEGNGKGEH